MIPFRSMHDTLLGDNQERVLPQDDTPLESGLTGNVLEVNPSTLYWTFSDFVFSSSQLNNCCSHIPLCSTPQREFL